MIKRKLVTILLIIFSGFGIYAVHNFIVRTYIPDARIGNIISFIIYFFSGSLFVAIKGRSKMLPDLYIYSFLLAAVFFDIQGLIGNKFLYPVIVPISTLSKIFGFYLGYNILKRGSIFYIFLLICLPLFTYITLIDIPKIEYNEQNNNFVPQLKQVNFTLLRTQSGDTIDSRGLKGKVVLLDFYFLNCKPCREKFPALEKLKSAFKDRNDVKIVGVYCDVDLSIKGLTPFLEKNKVTIATYIDKDLKLCKELGIKSYPVEVIINRKGEIVSTYWGFLSSASDKYLTERIKLINNLF